MQFDGSSSTLDWSASSAVFGSTDPFSIEFWYNAVPTSTMEFIDTRSSTSTNKGYVISKDNNGINFTINCDSSSSIQFYGAASSTILDAKNPEPNGHWHHLAITKNARTSINGFKLYFDGSQVTSTTVVSSSTLSGNCFTSSSTDFMRFSGSPTSSTGYLTGYMDEVRIRNTERSSSDITTYYAKEVSVSSTNLRDYWRFDNTPMDLVTGNATSGQNGSPAFSGLSPFGHFITLDPAVSGTVLLWASSTQYLTQWNAAVATWNTENKINVTSTASTSTANLLIDDLYNSSTVAVGFYCATDNLCPYGPFTTSAPAQNWLVFNPYYLSASTVTRTSHTVTPYVFLPCQRSLSSR
jgi:hypothetical protein